MKVIDIKTPNGVKTIPFSEWDGKINDAVNAIAYEVVSVRQAPVVEVPAPVVEEAVMNPIDELLCDDNETEFAALKEIGFAKLKADQRKRYSELK